MFSKGPFSSLHIVFLLPAIGLRFLGDRPPFGLAFLECDLKTLEYQYIYLTLTLLIEHFRNKDPK